MLIGIVSFNLFWIPKDRSAASAQVLRANGFKRRGLPMLLLRR
jgi:hypothetical protein